MVPYRKYVALVGCLLALAPGIAHGGVEQKPARKVRIVSLPTDAVLSEHGPFVLDSGAGVGFVSSVISGSLIAFSVSSGKVLSSVQLGEVAGTPSMVQIGEQRFIALPTANDPDGGRPATVNIINATRAEQLEPVAKIALPPDVRLTPNTRALLTGDGRFGVIAARSQAPALFSFNIAAGQVISRLPLSGQPSGIALRDSGNYRTVAVASPAAGALLIGKLDQQGNLSATGTVTLADAGFEDSNDPVFSADGRKVYIAAAKGDTFFVIDAESAAQEQGISVSCPQRIAVAQDAGGAEIIAITRLRHPSTSAPGGVTILATEEGELESKADFTPPDGSPLSRANNVVFSSDASLAFVGSATGILFSFDPKTGKPVSYTAVGGELRSLVTGHGARTLLAARSTMVKDDVAVINVDLLGKDKFENQQLPRLAPQINSVSTQGTYVHLLIDGRNFREGSIVEFVKSGNVVFKQSPVRVTDSQLTVAVPERMIAGLGKFEIRVVTGASIATDPVVFTAPSSDPAQQIQARSVQKEPIKEPSIQSDPTEGPPLSPASVVRAVRPTMEGNLVRIFIDTDGEAKIQAFALANPSRVVIDIFGVRNGFGNRTVQVGGGCIARVRTGQPKPGIVRVVLDTRGKARYRVTQEGSSLVVAACDPSLTPPERIVTTRR